MVKTTLYPIRGTAPRSGLSRKPVSGNAFPNLIIPTRCKVLNNLPFCNQADVVDLAQVALPPLSRELPALELLQEAAKLTVAHTPCTQTGLDFFASQMEKGYQTNTFTLEEFIQGKMCRCFERAIYLNLLMNKQAIPCTIIGGYTTETDQDNSARAAGHSLSKYDLAQLSDFDSKKGHRIYDHVWNLVYTDNRYFLVDCALTNADQEPIVVEVKKPARLLDHLLVVEVKGQDEQQYRYYNSIHSVTIKPLNP